MAEDLLKTHTTLLAMKPRVALMIGSYKQERVRCVAMLPYILPYSASLASPAQPSRRQELPTPRSKSTDVPHPIHNPSFTTHPQPHPYPSIPNPYHPHVPQAVKQKEKQQQSLYRTISRHAKPEKAPKLRYE